MGAASDRAFSVYMIRCANGDLYTGITKDVERRFDEHERGARGARFLRGKGPLKLVFAAAVGDRSVAARIEYRLKRVARSRKEALAAGLTTLEELLPGLEATRYQTSGDGRG